MQIEDVKLNITFTLREPKVQRKNVSGKNVFPLYSIYQSEVVYLLMNFISRKEGGF